MPLLLPRRGLLLLWRQHARAPGGQTVARAGDAAPWPARVCASLLLLLCTALSGKSIEENAIWGPETVHPIANHKGCACACAFLWGILRIFGPQIVFSEIGNGAALAAGRGAGRERPRWPACAEACACVSHRRHFCSTCHKSGWGANALACNPTTCMFGGEHPPHAVNGQDELSLGCGLCSQNLFM